MGFEDRNFGFGILYLGIQVWDSVFGFEFWCLWFGILEFSILILRFWVWDFECRVWDFEFRSLIIWVLVFEFGIWCLVFGFGVRSFAFTILEFENSCLGFGVWGLVCWIF